MTKDGGSPGVEHPTLYHICIQGVLDPSWSGRLEGLHIEVVYWGDAPPTTILSGWLEDQAALNGVLATLYGLGYPLRSVNAI